MDGYALRSADTVCPPVRLRLVAEVAAGRAAELPVAPGTAQRIFTGGALPSGADAVERRELVTERGAEAGLRTPVERGNDVRWRV